MRGNGERIGPQNLPTSSVAGGIWNLLNQQRAQQRGAWPSATPAVTTDPYFMYVPLLLNTTSTNAQQNNTFLDSSTNNFTITRNGTPTQGAFTPYQPSGYWSGYFSGSATTQVSVNPTISAIGTGNFTVEFLYFWTGDSGIDQQIIDLGATGFSIYSLTSSANIAVYDRVANVDIYSTSGYAITKNSWVYIAFVRSGTGAGQTALYINGTSVATAAVASNFSSTSANIGCRYAAVGSNWYPVNGYISNLRISNTARTITVPTAPYSADGNTLFLGLQSNRFINSSGTALTVNGTPKVQAFQPFAPAASYSAATYGGSGYFNGTTDYLSTASNAALGVSSSDFTIETWVYFTDVTGYQIVFDARTAQPSQSPLVTLQNTSRLLYLWNSATFVGFGPTTLTPNTWYHVAVVRASGVHTGYVNGVSYSLSTTDAAGVSSAPVILGARTVGGANDYLKGYLSNFRFVKGTAIYTAAFTPPTLPVTAVSGTSLLTNFTNAGIYDAAWQNNVTTVGDAQASTTITAKWPPTSMKFDGTGDYLNVITAPALNLSGSDFTIEAWIYLSSIAATGSIVSKYVVSNVASSEFLFWITSTGAIGFAIDGGGGEDYIASSAGTFATGSWYYVAVTRSGTGTNNVKLWQNGTQVAQGTSTRTMNVTSTALTIGSIGASNYFNGHIQDLRITKGVARTITTPTAAFPTR